MKRLHTCAGFIRQLVQFATSLLHVALDKLGPEPDPVIPTGSVFEDCEESERVQ